LIPAERLAETDTLLAFHHPSPSYPVHILMVPKGSYVSLLDLLSKDHRFEMDLFEVLRGLILKYELDQSDYRLIANGGSAQEDGVLHFHLVSGGPNPRLP
jgi:histidine triad (HIT) family protein